jgi:hypothetical protein
MNRAIQFFSVLPLLLAGCGPRTEIVLRQPFAPPAQQILRLATDHGYRAVVDDRQTCVFTFPLPGAAAGPRAFIIYISAPDKPDTLPVAPENPEGVRGFLIQEIGALAGRSDFVGGTLRCRSVFLAPRLRRLDLDLRTADGAEIVGRATIGEAPREVLALEREFAGDVAQLAPPTSQPAEQDAEAPPTLSPAP